LTGAASARHVRIVPLSFQLRRVTIAAVIALVLSCYGLRIERVSSATATEFENAKHPELLLLAPPGSTKNFSGNTQKQLKPTWLVGGQIHPMRVNGGWGESRDFRRPASLGVRRSTLIGTVELRV